MMAGLSDRALTLPSARGGALAVVRFASLACLCMSGFAHRRIKA